MAKPKRKAWTPEEEALLIETVKRFVKSGGTESEAFRHLERKTGSKERRFSDRWQLIKSGKVVPLQKEAPTGIDLESIFHQLNDHVSRIEQENITLKRENKRLVEIESDYIQMVKVFETARELVLKDIGTSSSEKTTFRMDTNGNLERV